MLVLLALALAGCPMEIIFEVTTAGGDSSSSNGESSSSTASMPTTSDASSGTATTSSVLVTTGDSGTSSGGRDASSSGEPTTSGTTVVDESSSGGGGDSSTGVPGAWFDCYGCLCDAAEHYCQYQFTGLKEAQPEYCPVVEANGADSGCVIYPRGCGDAPTCACIPTMSQKCFCTEVDGGALEVVCPLP